MAIDPNRVKEIFLEATEQADDAARAAFLDRACGGDAELRDRVEALLHSHDPDGSFLGNPVVALAEASGPTQELGVAEPQRPRDQTVALHAEGDDAMADKKKTDDDLIFLSPSTRPDSLGRLGHYEMLQVLGRGGFGIVFRAFDDILQRVVAVKVMAPQIAALSPARKRFTREAQSSAKVRHENVVQIYEVGEQPLPYLAMEFIPGETLQQKLDRSGPLDVPEILRIGRQIAEGLAAAHASNLIHRDIKPGNILLEGGSHKVKITDFGLARAADDASISQSGVVAGTPMFMAPEQALGHEIDQRADLFSLGSVLYQMASGRPPFRAPSALAVLKRVAEETPRPIPEIIPETPDWLCGIIAKLHAKNPDERFQSAREVADLLADCEAKLKAKQEVKNVLPPAVKPAGRKWIAAAAVLLLPVIALAVTEFAGVTHLFRQVERDPIKADVEPETRAIAGWSGWPKEAPKPAIAPFDAAQARTHQDAWANYLGVPIEFENSIGMKLRLIPPGEFVMGTPPAVTAGLLAFAGAMKSSDYDLTMLSDEGIPHLVRITKPFYMGTFEVTHAQFKRFVAATKYETDAERSGTGGWSNRDGNWIQHPAHIWSKPGEWDPHDEEPVVHMTWNDAKAFCDWLSDVDKRTYVLPSEGQWELACRAGTAGRTYAIDVPLENIAWTAEALPLDLSQHRPGRVGLKLPNAFGLHDMLGNVWEYCNDWYKAGETEANLKVDPKGPDAGRNHTLRGGGWYRSGKLFSRSSCRGPGSPIGVDAGIGFRVAIVGDLKAKTPPPAKAPFDAAKAKEYQNAWAKHLGVAPEITNSIGIKLRLIPPGEFMMGSPPEQIARFEKVFEDWAKPSLRRETPQRKEIIPAAFYLGSHEVTVGQFRDFVQATKHRTDDEKSGTGGETWNPLLKKNESLPDNIWTNKKFAPTDQHPVVFVTRNDAETFCRWLSEREGVLYSLPSEVEWEFACRAGTTTAWHWGDEDRNGDDFAWLGSNSLGTTHPVGLKKSNPFGLFDMLGNVQEMVAGTGPTTVMRGGLATLPIWHARSPSGGALLSNPGRVAQGFRVAIVGDLKPPLVKQSSR